MICSDVHVTTSGIFWRKKPVVLSSEEIPVIFLGRVFRHFFPRVQNQMV